MKQIYLLILTAILIMFINNQSVAQNIYKTLRAVQSDSLIQANETNPDFVILDVRTPGSWNPDHLYGSINRNYYDSDFDDQLNALPKHKTYLIHCQSGGRSAGTFSKMKNMNFAEVYEMSGGINAWKSTGLSTTSVIEPKLMLVAYDEISTSGSGNSDSIKITVTNRGNDLLQFSTAAFNDIHEINSNFDETIELEGAEDYTFSVVHSPVYSENDSTAIELASNGGNLDFSVVFKHGIIQRLENQQTTEFFIYPNPANQFFHINNYNGIVPDAVTILNMNGQVVSHSSGLSSPNLSVSNLINGVYFLKIETEGKTVSGKLIVKH